VNHRTTHRLPKPLCAGLGLLLAGLALAGTARGAAGPIVLGWELQHYGFATLTSGVGALVVNPAGMGGQAGADMHFDVTGDSGQLDEWVAGIQGGTCAAAYRPRNLHPVDVFPGNANVDSYVMGFGFGRPVFQIGATREVDKIDIPGSDATRWLFGIRSRPVSWLVVAGTLRDPQHPHYLDGTLTPRYTYGLSLVGDRGQGSFALSVEGSHLDGGADRIDLAYGLQAGFSSGLVLEAVLYDPAVGGTEFGFSIGTSFDRGVATARARTVEGDRSYRANVAVDFYDEKRGGGAKTP